MRLALVIAGIAVVGVVVVAVVRSDSDDGDEPAPDQPAPVETADPLPPLPRGWGKAANAEAGFALGVPPAWSQKSSGQTVTLKSPGSTAVIRVTADRSPDAIDSNLEEYAEELLVGLGASGAPEPVGGLEAAEGYELASVSGRGASQEVPRERLQVVVVRRPQLVAFPILIASDAGVKPADLDPVVGRVVSSLRGRPAG